MAVDISDMDQYGPAMAEYRQAKVQAQENGTDDDLTKVELNWERKKNELVQQKFTQVQSRQQLDGALAKVKTEFPDVPEEAYSHLSNPDDINATAKRIHETIAARTKGAEEGDEGSGGSWGAAPPAGGTGVEGETQNGENPDARYRRLADNIERKGNMARTDQQDLRRDIFDRTIGTLIDKDSFGGAQPKGETR